MTGRIVQGRHVGGRLVPPRAHGLRLADFSPNLSAFGPTPASTNYASAPSAQACLTDILGNDRLGDCTEADQYHRQALRQAASGSTVYHPATDVVIATYSRDTGYVVGDEATDQGGDETTVLDNAVVMGIADTAAGLGGSLHKSAGFLLVDATNRDLVRAAVTAFVGASICMGLPDAWVASMPQASGWTWDVPAGGFVADPNNGHCFSLLDQTDAKLMIGSWGMFGSITYDALAAGGVPGGGGALYVELDEDVILASIQRAPDSLDWRALVTAFDGIGGAVPVPGAPVPAITLLQRIEAALQRIL